MGSAKIATEYEAQQCTNLFSHVGSDSCIADGHMFSKFVDGWHTEFQRTDKSKQDEQSHNTFRKDWYYHVFLVYFGEGWRGGRGYSLGYIVLKRLNQNYWSPAAHDPLLSMKKDLPTPFWTSFIHPKKQFCDRPANPCFSMFEISNFLLSVL